MQASSETTSTCVRESSQGPSWRTRAGHRAFLREAVKRHRVETPTASDGQRPRALSAALRDFGPFKGENPYIGASPQHRVSRPQRNLGDLWRTTTSREQLQDTVDALRATEYPDLDAGLVAEILRIERDHLDLRSGVLVRLEQAIDAFLREAETP